MTNTNEIQLSLDKRIDELMRLITETKKRLPAHSAKPTIMNELFALEDEYDLLIKKRERLRAGEPS